MGIPCFHRHGKDFVARRARGSFEAFCCGSHNSGFAYQLLGFVGRNRHHHKRRRVGVKHAAAHLFYGGNGLLYAFHAFPPELQERFLHSSDLTRCHDDPPCWKCALIVFLRTRTGVCFLVMLFAAPQQFTDLGWRIGWQETRCVPRQPATTRFRTNA